MPTVTCKCKEVYHASDDHIGKQIQCRKCGRTVKIVAERKKRLRKERPVKVPKPPRASRSAPQWNQGKPIERERLNPVLRKRMMIAAAAFAGMSALLAAQIFRTLHALPDQPQSAPSDDGNGMVAPATPPLPTGLAVLGLTVTYAG